MSDGIPFTTGSEATSGWPPHRGPRPVFEPGPADIKAAKTAEKRAEKDRQRQFTKPSLAKKVITTTKTTIIEKLLRSDPEKPKKQRVDRDRDGVPIR
ncbi:uncharacterized protein ColSpa_07947 [Colletotrichum spaethianum]|uniref:Uncharacterized protein n=1 Tax=Colletotrichum spaethianum TaxID=700344 RepID=A0AA37P8U0_9PEZI|nr:uncharacterized protein ColSpa_07947 [Colletotrichum spaethianum]GKT47766.1 hypothetical protein ColSpa_07947 [Colletotrichum spaethianum]